MSTQIGLAASTQSADDVHPLGAVLELADSVSLSLTETPVVGPPVGSLLASVSLPEFPDEVVSATPSHSAS